MSNIQKNYCDGLKAAVGAPQTGSKESGNSQKETFPEPVEAV